MKVMCFFLVIAILLVGCSSPPVILATQPVPVASTSTSLPQKTSVPPTITHTPTETMTLTPPPTLEPEQAQEVIRILLQEAEFDCPAPCFLGIVPEETSFDETRSSLISSGFPIEQQYINNEGIYTSYELDNGLSISVLIGIQNNIVEDLRVYITPKKNSAEKPREWVAYSPETLIRRYGTPSKVEFFVGGVPPPGQLHMMILYFESANLIVNYSSYDSGTYTDTGEFHICPLINDQDHIRIWFGEHPLHPPLPEVSLEEATSMTLEEFSELMTGEPDHACIDLDMEAFY